MSNIHLPQVSSYSFQRIHCDLAEEIIGQEGTPFGAQQKVHCKKAIADRTMWTNALNQHGGTLTWRSIRMFGRGVSTVQGLERALSVCAAIQKAITRKQYLIPEKRVFFLRHCPKIHCLLSAYGRKENDCGFCDCSPVPPGVGGRRAEGSLLPVRLNARSHASIA